MKKYIALVIVMAMLLLGYAGIKFFFFQLENRVAAFIGNFVPEVSRLEDGRYKGQFGMLNNRMEARVEFIVENHQLIACNFDKLFGTPGHKAPYLVKQKIDQIGKLDFDAVSGATLTSYMARAAIKNAIEKGPVTR